MSPTPNRPLFPRALCPNIRRTRLGEVHASRPVKLRTAVIAWCGIASQCDLRARPTADKVSCGRCRVRALRAGESVEGNRAPVELTAARQRLYIRVHEQVLVPYKLTRGWRLPGRSDAKAAAAVFALQSLAQSTATDLPDPGDESDEAGFIDLIAEDIAALWPNIDTSGPDPFDIAF